MMFIIYFQFDYHFSNFCFISRYSLSPLSISFSISATISSLSLSLSLTHTHTHTYTHAHTQTLYIYIYIYVVHSIRFQTFFVWALLLRVHTWNSSPLRSNLLRLQCTCCTVPTTSTRPLEVLLYERVNDFRHSLFHLLNCLITTASELRE